MATYRCPTCARWRFDQLHLRGCLPKSKWAAELEQWPAPQNAADVFTLRELTSEVLSSMTLACGCRAVIDWSDGKPREYEDRCRLHARHAKAVSVDG